MLDDIIAHDIAQGIGVPIPTTQNCLLPPWTRIASRLRSHPTGLALLISEQTFQEQPCIRRNTLLREQRTYPLLDLSKRRRPQRKRLLNRRGPRPRHSNHGCPWIQKPAKKATVMLESVRRLQAGLQSFLSMRRIEARRKNAKAFRLRHSQSLARRRQRLSHAMVRSTIQRLGKTSNPLTRSERLTISTSRCGRTFASAFANFGPDIRCRRRASSKRETSRTVSP